ncbi:MAG: murein L,D-transpeptidase family protein [Pseudomonadota bacterium]|nr:murein L,D-transpeptidase [Hyphomicrobiales bacterium]
MSRPLPRFPRLRIAALATVAALALAGCTGDGNDISAKARQPLSAKTLALIDEKGMSPQSPILVRIYKQEAELEVWKEKRNGEYALLKTYPICRWSGDIGPKVKIGDRQAPEGFYTITPGQMNPNSSYYLSFNLGFPNAYDRSYGRTGEFLMVHGDCSSAGCYAMTDEQIAEVYALGREAFEGGQKSFQVQALPFRMTATNLAKHRNNPAMPFWKNLKEGTDAFDVSHREPKVNVCNRRYVFNATPDGGRGFDANLPCPSYTVEPTVAQAVFNKQHADDAKVAEIIGSTPMAPSRAGVDGGMHPIFLAKFKEENPAYQDGPVVAAAPAPGTIPKTTRPPRVQDDGFTPIGAVASTSGTATLMSMAPVATPPAAAPGQQTASLSSSATASTLSGANGILPSAGFGTTR